jgi:hypothetical protein
MRKREDRSIKKQSLLLFEAERQPQPDVCQPAGNLREISSSIEKHHIAN